MEVINQSEQTELKALELEIGKGIKAFVRVGMALMRIRDARLYREKHHSFEDYCRHRLDMTRDYAYKLMTATQAYENLSVDNCIQLPATESQARPLTQLDPELQSEAWRKAVETAPRGKVTAKHVQSTVRKYFGDETTESKAVKQLNPDKWWAETADLIMNRIREAPAGNVSTKTLQTILEINTSITAQYAILKGVSESEVVLAK